MENLERTILSQYANSPTIMGMIESLNAAIDPSADLDNVLTWILQVSTAGGFGLDICGRIVGVSRNVPTTPVTVLTDDQFRSIILLKSFSNISRSTSTAINTLLSNWMADRGRAYVNDLGNMEIKYQFEFPLEPFEIDILTQTSIFLRPAGVGGWMVQSEYPVFGFAEMGTTWAAPFGQAPFLPFGNPYPVVSQDFV